MTKIAVIGICGVSLFMEVDHFHQNGETLVADRIFEEVGGKGINQAIAAGRMGAEVSFLTAIGDDANGKKCVEIAKNNKINAKFKLKQGKSTPLAVILTDKCGENQVTEYGTAHLNETDVSMFENDIATSDILLIQQEVPQNINNAAIKIANKYDVKVILNPAPIRQIPDSIVKSIFAVTPNKHEAQAINAERFKNCIVTLGGDGCVINEKIKLPPLSVNAVDTTGAGDTFNGVFAACIGEGMNIETACKYAVTASGISVSRKYVLNAIPYREEIERMMING